uniref:Uncharacterized protein n=1 Tax=Rhizophora mucronata TaxID=61149 RepID=A0A2P2NLK1_RHIMU
MAGRRISTCNCNSLKYLHVLWVFVSHMFGHVYIMVTRICQSLRKCYFKNYEGIMQPLGTR